MLSICGSLLIGRQARALCESEPSEPPVELALPAALVREGALLSASAGVMGRASVAYAPRAIERATARASERAVSAHQPEVSDAERSAPLPLLSGKVLSLFDVNGGRGLKVMPFDQDGLPNAVAFAQIRSFMRCRRSGHEMDMDPRLIAVLSRIAQHFGDATLHVISGHRKPDGKVTRETSQHAFGTAADIRVPGVPIERVKEAAHLLGAKGVGLYTEHQFVHVDVRQRAYAWQDNGDESEAGDAPQARSHKLEPAETVAGEGGLPAEVPTVAAAL